MSVPVYVSVNRARPETPWARLSTAPDGHWLVYQSSYDSDLIDTLKRHVPFAARRWDGASKSWLIDPAYGQAVVDVTTRCLGINLRLPLVDTAPKPTETRLIRLEYLGRCKERQDGSVTATGWADGSWSVVFPEAALRAWYLGGLDSPTDPRKPVTLYEVLGVPLAATAEQLKAAWRRLALAWHPDRNPGDADAPAQFRRVKEAYDVLSSPDLRARYDFGLTLEAQVDRTLTDRRRDEADGYRAPDTCGFVLAEGTARLGVFVIACILEWQPITASDGRVFASWWPKDAKHHKWEWRMP